jgi:hypothetical protein
VSDDLGVLPIRPGSAEDIALNSIVANMMAKMPFNMDAFQLIAMSNPNQMLALGTRCWCYKAGIKEPNDLVSVLYQQWYGQPRQS